MRWRRTLTLGAALAMVPAVAEAQVELSVQDRLKDRREVAAGTRAYSVGFQDGRFYANGWHITGEMGGDLGAAAEARRRRLVRRRRRSGWAGDQIHERARATCATTCRRVRPAAAAHRLRPRRPPRRALRARAGQPGRRRQDGHGQGRRALRADQRVPVGVHRRDPEREADNLPDTAALRRGALVFTDRLAAGASTTTRRSSTARPPAADTGPGFRGPQPGTVCDGPTQSRAARLRRRPVRQGHRRPAALQGHGPARAARRSGSRSPAPTRARRARARWRCATRTPSSRPRSARARGSAQYSASTCPATAQLQEAVDWGKQNLADLTQTRDRAEAPLRRPGQGLPGAGGGDPAARRSSAPAIPTTRGCSPPTASTRRSRPSRSASSRRSGRT